MVYKHSLWVLLWNAFDYMACVVGSNMAPYINDQHILYYHKDTFWSLMMGHSYFQSPDYLVFQGWIIAMLLHPTNIKPAGLNVHHYTKFFPGVVVYSILGNMIVPSHRTAAVLYITYHFVITTFPAL